MIGKRFGKLVVIKDSGQRYYKHVVYECLCDCGNIKLIPSLKLNKELKSCGCSWHDKGIKRTRTKAIIPKRSLDRMGTKIHRLTIIDFKKELNIPLRVILRCDCGSVINKPANDFLKGRIKSCGCISKEKSALAKVKREANLAMPPKKYSFTLGKDISNQTIGRITVLYWCGIRLSTSGGKSPIWVCRCVCGKELIKTTVAILSGKDVCGCTHYAKRKQRALIQADKRKKKILSYLSEEWSPRDDIDHNNRRFRLSSKSRMLIKYPNGCLICGHGGDKENYICAHHLKTHSLFPNLRYLTVNLIPLCKNCHDVLHKELGWENVSVKKQFEYINNKRKHIYEVNHNERGLVRI